MRRRSLGCGHLVLSAPIPRHHPDSRQPTPEKITHNGVTAEECWGGCAGPPGMPDRAAARQAKVAETASEVTADQRDDDS